MRAEDKYLINEEYLLKGFNDEPDERVELQKIDGISAFVKYIERPLMHPFRYGEVTIFRLLKK